VIIKDTVSFSKENIMQSLILNLISQKASFNCFNPRPLGFLPVSKKSINSDIAEDAKNCFTLPFKNI
jgi:hypothetical protein